MSGTWSGAAGQPTVLASVVSSKPLYVTVDASEDDLLAVRRARIAKQPGASRGRSRRGVAAGGPGDG
jgi:hypothetical protein